MKITTPTNNPPSRKRTKIVIATLVLICIVGLAWLLRPAPEPSYNGKSFSLWLEEYGQLIRNSKTPTETPTEEQAQAMEALGKMGPKAVPIIIRTMEKYDTPMKNKYWEI